MTEKQVEEFAEAFATRLHKLCPNFIDVEEIVNLAIEYLPEADEAADTEE